MWSRHVTLWCDYEGGREAALAYVEAVDGIPQPPRGCVIWTDYGMSGVEETRAAASKEGWLYVEAKDLCPEHARLDPDGRALLERGRVSV
jgi:hypothetical protein